MGVMQCSRSGCDEIMCDRLINGRNYICNTCFTELVDWKREHWPDTMTIVELTERIQNFLSTEKGSHRVLDAAEIEKEFQRITNS